jgi:alkylation response protein AidB-like acyl-CoA dehydrogenase
MTVPDIDPSEFVQTAERAVLACAGLALRQQAARLAEDGLLGILTAEAAGGLGLDLSFAVPVVAAAASGLFGFPLPEAMLLSAAFGGTEPGAAILAGEKTATIAWSGSVSRRGDRVEGVAGRAPCAADCDFALVSVGDGAMLVSLAGAGVSVSESAGLDVDGPEHDITLTNAPVVATLAEADFARLQSDAMVLRTAAMMGAAEACLKAAIEHVSTRQQFGRPLVAFQVLRHALARQKLGIENIRAAIARSLHLPPDGVAGVLSRRAAFTAAVQYGPPALENALQLHGGMGFTWAVPMHRYLRRVRSWEMQGDAPGVRRAIARTLLDANARIEPRRRR